MTKTLTGALLFCSAVVHAQTSDLVKVTELMTKELTNVPGKEVLMIVVDSLPGGVDPVHRHNAPAFVYVLEGSIVMQMKGEKEVTLHAGDSSTKTLRAFIWSEKMPVTRNPPNMSSF